MALTPLKYDPRRNGEWVPPGIVAYKPFDDSFIGASALPSWLTVPAVTGQATEGAVASFGNFPGARSFLTVTSAARANAQAKLAYASSFDTTLFAGCLWELDGVKFSTDTAIVAVGVAGSGGKGVYLQQTTTDTTAFLRWGAGAGSQAINAYLRSGGIGTSLRQSIKLFYNFAMKSVYVYIGSECVGAIEDVPNIGAGVIQPDISITTGASATSVSLTIARARLSIWTNNVP